MRKQTVLLVMALCIMGIVTCVMWGERDAERALRSSAESRLAQTREQLIQAQALQEDAEDALSAGKETWQEQLATVTAERDELSVSNAALQAQAEEAANALAQVQTQQESLEAKEQMKELILDISHQTRTPIANQKLCLEILRREELPEETGVFLDRL